MWLGAMVSTRFYQKMDITAVSPANKGISAANKDEVYKSPTLGLNYEKGGFGSVLKGYIQ